MKRTIFSLLLLLITVNTQAQEKQLTIRGKVTTMDTPLINAEVQSDRTGEVVKTDAKGMYQLQTSPGDLVIFSYPGLADMEIVVEDVTSVLNIKMNSAVNVLDEVVVEKTKDKKPEAIKNGV